MSPQQILAHYRLTAKLGEGGMGEVWRATDTKLNRDVAIKMLPDVFVADPDRVARFQREAQVLASLNHPNIAAIHGLEERALVLELVEGPTLADRIAQGPIPLDEALAITAQIADGVEYAHDRGVIHRDLKPANIKITPEGRVKILDFGLAKALSGDWAASDPASSPTLTMRATAAGVIMGTAAYMSPEQARGKPADRRSDVWSFGVILYEIVTGRCLFHGETVSDILAAVLKGQLEVGLAPERLHPLLKACLERDPSKRLRSVADWRLLLSDSVPARVPAPPPSAKRFAPWAVALAMSVVAGWALWRAAAPVPPAASYTLSVVPPDGATFYLDAGGSGVSAISPDGRSLAFVATVQGARHVWVRPLDSSTSRLLSGTENADGVFWSPDSRHVGVVTYDGIMRVDLATGAVKEVCRTVSTLRGAAWGPGGTIVFGVSHSSGLFRVPADGGTPRPLTALDLRSENNHNWPQFLPGGRRILYWIRSVHPDRSGMAVAELDVPAERQSHAILLQTPSRAQYAAGKLLFVRSRTLLAQPFDVATNSLLSGAVPVAEDVGRRASQSMFWTSDNDVLAYSTAADSSRIITVMSRDGKVLRAVGDPNFYMSIRLSRDGRMLAVVAPNSDNSTFDIWLMEMDRGVPTRLTDDAALNFYPVFSPDGKDVLYASNRGEEFFHFYRKSIGGGPSQRVDIAGSMPLDWARAGDTLLYLTGGPGKAEHVMAGPVSGATPAVEVESSTSVVEGASLSPSGHWAAFASKESGSYEIYVKRVGGGANAPKVRVSRTGGRTPAWSADEKELYFTSPDDRLMAARVHADGERFNADEPQSLFPLGGHSSFVAAIFWQPVGNGQQFVVMRSAAVAERDNRITIVTNWQGAMRGSR
jgi:Tol biopolymer transport system component